MEKKYFQIGRIRNVFNKLLCSTSNLKTSCDVWFGYCFNFLFLKRPAELLVFFSCRAITKAKETRMDLTAFKISIFI